MSGGAWDYLYGHIGCAADALRNDTTTESRRPLLELNEEQLYWRHRLAEHLMKISTAMHAVEWVDSGDTSYPSDVEAIKKVFKDLE